MGPIQRPDTSAFLYEERELSLIFEYFKSGLNSLFSKRMFQTEIEYSVDWLPFESYAPVRGLPIFKTVPIEFNCTQYHVAQNM